MLAAQFSVVASFRRELLDILKNQQEQSNSFQTEMKADLESMVLAGNPQLHRCWPHPHRPTRYYRWFC